MPGGSWEKYKAAYNAAARREALRFMHEKAIAEAVRDRRQFVEKLTDGRWVNGLEPRKLFGVAMTREEAEWWNTRRIAGQPFGDDDPDRGG